MSWGKKLLLRLGFALFGLSIVGGITLVWLRSRLASAMVIDRSRGLDETHEVNIRGTVQWLNVRGHDRNKPFVLYLDGGPGKPSTPWMHTYQMALEHEAVMVHWEQRGAGHSFDEGLLASDMTLDNFVQDGIQVLDWVRDRYGVEKVVLLGHSFGSLLGVLLAQRAPEKVAAYIGVGQAVSLSRGWALTVRDLQARATREQNAKLLSQLEGFAPPFVFGAAEVSRDQLRQFFWLQAEQGCEVHGQGGYGWLLGEMLLSPLYGWSDHIDWYRGLEFTNATMTSELLNFDLAKRVSALSVPVSFLLGRYDCNTHYAVAKEYFEALHAPSKRLVWFENSAHGVPFEEPEKFQRVVAQIVSQPAIARAASMRKEGDLP